MKVKVNLQALDTGISVVLLARTRDLGHSSLPNVRSVEEGMLVLFVQDSSMY